MHQISLNAFSSIHTAIIKQPITWAPYLQGPDVYWYLSSHAFIHSCILLFNKAFALLAFRLHSICWFMWSWFLSKMPYQMLKYVFVPLWNTSNCFVFCRICSSLLNLISQVVVDLFKYFPCLMHNPSGPRVSHATGLICVWNEMCLKSGNFWRWCSTVAVLCFRTLSINPIFLGWTVVSLWC